MLRTKMERALQGELAARAAGDEDLAQRWSDVVDTLTKRLQGRF